MRFRVNHKVALLHNKQRYIAMRSEDFFEHPVREFIRLFKEYLVKGGSR